MNEKPQNVKDMLERVVELAKKEKIHASDEKLKLAGDLFDLLHNKLSISEENILKILDIVNKVQKINSQEVYDLGLQDGITFAGK